ncbi:MAG: stage III sporulation protein AE [Clostridia bacterium]|nr:stage III sporulation protein AE [Clostridia bacterium]
MKKFWMFWLICLGTLFLWATVVQAAPVEKAPGTANQKIQNTIDLSQIDQYLTKIDRELAPYIPDLSLKNFLDNLRQGKVTLDIAAVFTGILKYLFKEVMANTHLLGKLIILGVIMAVIQNLTVAFEKGTVSKAAQAVVFLVVITLAIGSLTIAINLGRTAVTDMVSFMQVLFPILLTLLAAMGGLASAAIFHPVMVLVLGLLSTVVKNIIIPLIFFSAILGFVNSISDRFQVSRLAGLFRQVSITLVMLLMTIFIGVISVQGVAGSVADGVALRTAKFATDAFIPVVGGMFSDAVDAVIGGSLLLKNAVGLVGVIIIFALCALPSLKILALIFVYKLAGALMQPIGAGQVADCLEHLEKSLTVLFAAVSAVGLMFFFAVTIVVGAGNMATMLR